MSAIIINLSPDYALVATDTLIVQMPDFRPAGFTEKARYWAEAKLIVAGTGLAGFSDFWLEWLMTGQRAFVDVVDLDAWAPAALAEMYRLNTISTSVYHIGVSTDGTIRGFRYSSEQNFESKPIPYGQTMKPSAGPEPDEDNPRSLEQLMLDQRAIQETLRPDDRVYIGGRIYLLDLQPDGISQNGYIDTFD